MAVLNIDKLTNNPASQVLISAGSKSGVNVRGYITDEISITGTSQHNMPLFSNAQQSLADTYNKVIAGTGAASSAFGFKGGALPNISPVALEQSVASWTGTEKPRFTVRLVFVALKETDDVRKQASALYRTVFPTTAGIGKANFLKAPLGYAPAGLKATGTLAIEVGRWFRASGQIMTSVDFAFSKQSIASGAPLYAHGSISFEPYRNVTIFDINSYLRL